MSRVLVKLRAPKVGIYRWWDASGAPVDMPITFSIGGTVSNYMDDESEMYLKLKEMGAVLEVVSEDVSDFEMAGFEPGQKVN